MHHYPTDPVRNHSAIGAAVYLLAGVDVCGFRDI